jgi:signal transduction histidine kinase
LGAAERVLNSDPAAAREHLVRARGLAREGLAESRRSVWALRSDALEGNSLCEALMHLRDQMTGGQEVSLDFRMEGVARALPPEVALNLLRIGQEALTNAVKHARAKRITMKLTFLDEQVELSVEDDGEGFEQAAVVQRRGFGLLGIRERSDRIGGQLRIDSRLSAGTRVAVVVPLPGDSTRGGTDE